MKNFIIYTYPFSLGIGGVKVLHKLCDVLNKNGQNAYLYPIPFPGQMDNSFIVNTSYNTPIVTNEILNDVDNCVVIYPEIIKGNPLNAKTVVRWLLNKADGFLDTYNKNDIIVYYAKTFYSDILKNENNILLIQEFHSDIFKNFNMERRNSCYAVRKCPSPVFQHPENSLEIKWGDVGNLELMSTIFNTTEYFYCYDDVTFLSTQAAMCGCIPIIIPFRYSKEEWTTNTPKICRYGVAYGNTPEELDYAKKTQPLIFKEIEILENDMTQINNFISLCQ